MTTRYVNNYYKKNQLIDLSCRYPSHKILYKEIEDLNLRNQDHGLHVLLSVFDFQLKEINCKVW